MSSIVTDPSSFEDEKSSSKFESSNYENYSIEELTLEEDRLTRKLDLRLLPGLTLLYLLSFIDRTNVGAAKLGGLLQDIGLGSQPSAYNTALALYFLGYVIFEIPSNLVVKRGNPALILPILCITWGIVSLCQGFVTNPAGFYAARFFLGVSEAGLFPACLYVLSLYYKREQRALRISFFFGGAALAGAFGGILAYLLEKMDGLGDTAGWKWIFFIEGAITIVIGLSAFFWAPGYPHQATFLNEREKQLLSNRIRSDLECSEKEPFAWNLVRSSVLDPHILLYCALFFSFSFPLYSLSLFLPTIITQLGYKTWQAQLLTTPPYVLAFIAIFTVAYYSKGRRIASIGSGGSFAIIGYILLITAGSPVARYIGAIIAVIGTYVSVSLLLGLPLSNLQNQTKRAVAGGQQIFLGDIGAIAGVLVYQPSPHLSANLFRIPNCISILFIVMGLVVSATLYTLLRRENLRMLRETGSVGEGKGEEGVLEKKQLYLYHL